MKDTARELEVIRLWTTTNMSRRAIANTLGYGVQGHKSISNIVKRRQLTARTYKIKSTSITTMDTNGAINFL